MDAPDAPAPGTSTLTARHWNTHAGFRSGGDHDRSWIRTMIYVAAWYDRDPSFYVAPPMLQRMADAGRLGRKPGSGFYSY
ncbi:3-hydroxyacyl-CoA dehydrogenase family protein [Streptomyces sp. NPDC101150]|uniref:3-hydroxyacyl-CoA dehydrogenase family protein n=1 Tax=Streptomyces sp. NPDC101150 TaxID=3366114 RepID=UPI0038139262